MLTETYEKTVKKATDFIGKPGLFKKVMECRRMAKGLWFQAVAEAAGKGEEVAKLLHEPDRDRVIKEGYRMFLPNTTKSFAEITEKIEEAFTPVIGAENIDSKKGLSLHIHPLNWGTVWARHLEALITELLMKAVENKEVVENDWNNKSDKLMIKQALNEHHNEQRKIKEADIKHGIEELEEELYTPPLRFSDED